MKKGFLPVIAACLIALLLVAGSCGKAAPTATTSAPAKTTAAATTAAATTSKPAATTSAPAATTAAPKTAAFKWPSELGILVGAIGSGNHAQAVALAPLIEKATGMKVRVVAETSTTMREVRLWQGDMALQINPLSAHIGNVYGEAGAQGYKVGRSRTIWLQMNCPYGLCVRGDSVLKTIDDLKTRPAQGKDVKFIYQSTATGMVKVVNLAMPAFLDMPGPGKPGGYTPVPIANNTEQIRALGEGRGDVSWISPITATTYEIESGPYGIRWLDMPFDNTKGWEKFLAYCPDTPPLKASSGVASAIGHQMTNQPFIYQVTTENEDDFAYNLSKWFNENYSSFKDLTPTTPDLALKYFRGYIDAALFPIAKGTIRYLKEIGQWTAKDDQWNDEAIKNDDKMVQVRDTFLAEAKAKGIAADSKDAAELWTSKYVPTLPPLAARSK